MLYNTYSESDLESETNFQQNNKANNRKNSNNSSTHSNGSKFIRNNSIKNSNQQLQQNLQQVQLRHSLSSARRRASECSYYGVTGGFDGGMGTADNISFYSASYGSQKRSSLAGFNGKRSFRRSKSPKSTASTASSADVSHSSGSSTCSDGETTSTSSGQPNLPYPGFVEYSFKYLSQDARPRNWCLRLITNPYPFKMTYFASV